ncbi:MAG: SGNH/GDSL hydrolase family protein [Nitriliruptorales bacterium]|nr:SGNH/GDSL hydrolase family protein [Nitriliruptorales bacterium]
MSSESAPHLLVPEGDARRGTRPEGPEPFLRGVAWPGTSNVPYPRVNPIDRMRVPGDTWQMASIPVGVRLELAGDADEVEIVYRTTTDQTGYRGDGAGVTFAAWTSDGLVAEEPAVLGEGKVRLPLADAERTIVYLPEGMRPWILEVSGVGGTIQPAAKQPRWIVYGDSVAEGWIASSPAGAWPAIAGRQRGLDHVNLGYAGAARGETASAEQVAKLDADLITVSHGTNCWTRTPHSVAQMAANTAAFLDILRQDQPTTPIQVVTPVIRPDAEETPNRLGATLAMLRQAMGSVARNRMAEDDRMSLVNGEDLIDEGQLGDGIHPDDAGHRAMADAIGADAVALRNRVAG